MTTFHISAKSYSWILFKHQNRASPLPFSCGTNTSRFTSRFFRVPSVYSADYRAKYITGQNRERPPSSQFAPAEVLGSHTFIPNRYNPGPHVPPSVCLFQDGGLKHCITIDFSSLIPLISPSSWRNGACTLETVRSMKGTISYIWTCYHGPLIQCVRWGVHQSGLSQFVRDTTLNIISFSIVV